MALSENYNRNGELWRVSEGHVINFYEVPVPWYNLEVFYRFPIFPGVDTTLSYQSVFDPALNTEFDHAHVFSLRLRTVF